MAGGLLQRGTILPPALPWESAAELDVFSWRVLLAVCIALLLAGLAAGLRLLWQGRPRPFVRRLVLLALAIELALALAYLSSLRDRWPTLLQWFANVNTEYTPGTIFSSAQLLVAGVTALVIVALLRERGWPGRAYLLATGSAFLFLGLDEFFEVHEYIWQLAPDLNLYGLHLWRLLYIVGGGGLALATLLVWRQRYRELGRVFALLFLGLAVTGLSGIVVEHVTLQAWCWTAAESGQWVCDNPQQWLVFEEIFEIVGVTLALGALLLFAQERLERRAWRWLTRIVPVTWALALVSLPVYLWILPDVEKALTATPIRIAWYEGGLELQGVRIDGSPAGPGDEISVWLYWQKLGRLPKNLHVSLHALERPELAQSLASDEQDDIGQFNIEGWVPGVTVRKRLTLRLPEEMNTPVSLALMLRVWRGNWAKREILGVAVDSSDRQLLGPDQVVIGSVAVPGPAPPGAGWRPLEARFGGQLALSDYRLPEEVVAGSALTLALDWRALTAPGANFTQFLHFFAAADDRFVAGFDEAPFRGRFPTSDWPAGHALRDEWQVSLPPELTPGDYRLVFGLYDARTLERLPLQVAGEDVQDGLLPLGRLRVVAAG